VRSRDDYLGRFDQNVALLTVGTGWGAGDGASSVDFFWRLKNPAFLRAPNTSQTLELFDVEGRYGATLGFERRRQKHLGRGALWSHGLTLQSVHPDELRYLDRLYYDDAGTVELAMANGVTGRSSGWRLGLGTSLGGGLVYNRGGLDSTGRADLDQFYLRATVEATARKDLAPSLDFGVRVFAGGAGGQFDAVKQRQIYFQGADPLEQLGNPFLRSRGALLVGDDFRYHQPGGAGVRGADPRLSTASIVALDLELERTVLARPRSRLFNRVGVAVFGDLSHAIGGTAQASLDDRIRFLGDAGIGIRADHRIGDTRFVTRIDLPIWFSRPEVAHDRSPEDGELAFRWVFSFQPAF
jgi:hypothetical protein